MRINRNWEARFLYVSKLITSHTNINQLIDHLFRHESGKMVAVLTKLLGPANIELAEDMVQEAMTEAINQWSYKGVPENPCGWLYQVAKYKAINFSTREKQMQKYAADAKNKIQSETIQEPDLNQLFSEQEVADDQLRMMFICCHPSISTDSQIALILKTLCGFSIPEIAKSFLTNEENINKRLVRARKTIRENKIDFELPRGNEFINRLDTVLETIYLVFNEGYNSSAGDELIRFELCEEAIHLAQLIVDHPQIATKSEAYALLALMLLNASRFAARLNEQGKIIEMALQNRAIWNKDFIRKGIAYLYQSTEFNTVSKYQILAAISAHHCTAASDETTNWKDILSLYEHLSVIDSSPIVLLNKSVAVSKVLGYQQAINDLLILESNTVLKTYPHFYSTIGEFYLKQNDLRLAGIYFKRAISLSGNKQEISYLNSMLELCGS